MGYGVKAYSAADWGGGMSVVLRIEPQVPLAHANQLPLPRL